MSTCEFLYLKEEDMIKAGVLDVKRCVEVTDEVFKLIGKDDYLMGGPKENDHGLKIWFPEQPKAENMPVAGPDRRFTSLIAYVGGRFHVCGNKWYGSNIANRDKNLPRSIHTMTLNDVETGAPLSIMSGNLISAMRTGAVPGVAAKYLASKNAEVVGLVGTGVINRASILSIYETQKQIRKVKIFDIDFARAESFKNEIKEYLDSVEIEIVKTLQDCIENSDIINMATSGSVKPKIEDNWLKKGSLLILTGGAKLSDETYKNNKIVADNWKMHEAWLRDAKEHPKGVEHVNELALSGDLLDLYHKEEIKREDIIDLGELASENNSRPADDEKVIFITGGMSVEDVAWAHEVYKNALENNIGQSLALWDQPHWT